MDIFFAGVLGLIFAIITILLYEIRCELKEIEKILEAKQTKEDIK